MKSFKMTKQVLVNRIKSIKHFTLLFAVMPIIVGSVYAGGLTSRTSTDVKSEGNFYMLDTLLYSDAIVLKFSEPVVSISSTTEIYAIGDIGKSYTEVIDALDDLDAVFGVDEIVKMIPDITAADTTAVHRVTGQPVSIINNSQLFIINFNDPVPVDSVCSELEDLDDVDYAHVPVSMMLYEQPNDPLFTDGSSNIMWYYDAINIVDAWDITHGSSSTSIGVVEWGACDNHEDFTNKVESISTDVGSQHSIRVSSIVAARCNNGTGLAGIGWNTKLRLYGVDNEDDLYSAAQIHEAWRRNEVITFSIPFTRPVMVGEASDLMGSCGPESVRNCWINEGQVHHNFPEIEDEIANAISRGTVVIAAAGNGSINTYCSNPNLCDPVPVPFTTYPAAYPGVIAVSGTTLDEYDVEDFKDGWNYGSFIDVSAPGTGINLADGFSSCSTDDDYTNSSGTSYSAPIVAGLASLIVAMEPYADVGTVLANTADEIGIRSYDGNGWNNHLGHGRIDALAALESLIPSTPTNFTVTGDNGEHPVLTWSSNPENDIDKYKVYRSFDSGSFYYFVTVNAPTTTFTDNDITISSGKFDPTVCYKLSAVDDAGNESDQTIQRCKKFDQTSKGAIGDTKGIPELSFSLHQAYPNPFNMSVLINFDIPSEEVGTLIISDILGSVIRDYSQGGTKVFQYGAHSVVWDGTDGKGVAVGSGVYFIHLRAGTSNFTQKILLSK